MAAAAFGHPPIHLTGLRPGIDATSCGPGTVL